MPDTERSARAIRSSVTPAIADTTTTGRARANRLTMVPTWRICGAPASDVPPNFMTIMIRSFRPTQPPGPPQKNSGEDRSLPCARFHGPEHSSEKD